MAPPSLHPKPEASNQNVNIQMHQVLQQRRVNMSDSQSTNTSTLIESMQDSAYDLNSNMVTTTPSTTPPAVKSMAPPPTQKHQVLPDMPPLPLPPFINGIISPPLLPTKTTKAGPQASNQNNGDNINDLFKQIREGVKLKPADAKQDVNQVAAVAQPAAAKPGTGNIMADALFKKLENVQQTGPKTDLEINPEIDPTQMQSFYNSFSLSS